MRLLAAPLVGALGAVIRYVISGWVQNRSGVGFPTGTFTVNILGAFGLGLVIGFGDMHSTLAISGAAFFGGFTTFSTWMVETIRLGTPSRAVLNLVLSGLGGVMAVVAGYMLAG